MNETMNDKIEIICKTTNTTVHVDAGTSINQLIEILKIENPKSILGAYVNNKVQSLNYKLFLPRTLEFIDINNVNGRRIYGLSLMFLLYKSLKDLYPDAELVIRHSMLNGFYAELDNLPVEISEEVVKSIKAKMDENVEKDLSFTKKIIPAEKAIELYKEMNMPEKAEHIKTINRLYTNVDYLDGYANHFYYDLVPSTSYLKVFDLQSFENGVLLVMPSKEDPSQISNGGGRQTKIFSVFQEYQEWINILGTPYVSKLNKVVENKEEISLIQISEALHEKRYSNIADKIFRKRDKIKIVLLAGPSSSGKTTSCRRLATQLSVLGLSPIQISLDDYFLDREFTPRDENGEYDFETINALDIELFDNQMSELMSGKRVGIPRFNFITGKKEYNGNYIQLKENSILIVEGIHALNPKLSSNIAMENKYHIFVSALTQIALDRHNLVSSSDNRLIRRLVRDYNYRGYSAIDTLSRWQSVRAGEEKHIFPFQEKADSVFNSTLLYEFGVLKPYAEPLLSAVPQNVVEYAEAKRLLSFLSNFKPIKYEFIPPTSIIREFLGGSSFEY